MGLVNKRMISILDSLSDEVVSVIWAWMEETPQEEAFDQITEYLQARGISLNDARDEM